MKSEQIKEEILRLTKEYYKEKHIKPDYKEGDRISYGGRFFDEKEIVNLVDSSLEFWLTTGRYADEFEKKLADFLGLKYCYAVNSGSSANLLAFMTLTSPLLEDRAIKRGDEVITVACGFPTTVTPIIQYGAVPVFLDITIPQYNINVEDLEKAISPKTKAVMIAHTLGNPFDIKAVKEFCDKHNLWLIEDNCDALGSRYTVDGKTSYTGTFGDIGTSSFYPPHHITMGEGGAVYTNNSLLAKIALSMRDWGRDCVCPSGVDNLCNNRFNKQYGELPVGYDHKFVYSHFGYNLKITDMQASVGVAQLDKLETVISRRRENFEYLYNKLSVIKDKIILPEPLENSTPSWFGFLITVKSGTRNDVINHLEVKNSIQTRNLFAGNLIKHPCFTNVAKDEYRVIGDLKVTDTILNDTFWIGVYPGMSNKMLDVMAEAIIEICS